MLFRATVVGIKKSSPGTPGELRGDFAAQSPCGSILKNTRCGVFGTLKTNQPDPKKAVPAADEVVVRIEGAPINPSDLGLLLGPADIGSAKVTGSGADTVVTAPIPPQFMRAMGARVDDSMPVGNEGAGVVIAAGDSPEAQALLGKMVAILGGATYAQHRSAKAALVRAVA